VQGRIYRIDLLADDLSPLKTSQSSQVRLDLLISLRQLRRAV
jgi:hypothetical protein